MYYLYRNPRIFFLGVIIALTLLYWVFPDIMPFNGGFGFEGFTIYKPFTKDVSHFLFVEKMNSYSIQRIFPYVLLYVTFKIFSIEFSDPNMLMFFQILQLLLGIIIIEVWNKLARHLRLGLPGQWVGYLSMLINFATIKLDFYIPFTYDRLALSSGLISLYFYFTDKKLPLLINALLGLIIWPTALLFNLIMLLIPRELVSLNSINKPLSILWSLATSGIVCLLFIAVVYVKKIPEMSHMAPAVRSLIPLSILIVFACVSYTQYTLASRIIPVKDNFAKMFFSIFNIDVKWLYIFILIMSYILLTRVLGNSGVQYLTPQQFAINLTYGALQRPGQSVLFHIIYYGLPFMIMSLFWHRLLDVIAKLGIGVCLMLMAVLLQAVNSETRQMANMLPLFALISAAIINTMSLRKRQVLVLSAVAILLSKAWLLFRYIDPGYVQKEDLYPMKDFANKGFLNWPQQAYFMNFGPWASNFSYVIQLGCVLVLMLVIYATLRKQSALNNESI